MTLNAAKLNSDAPPSLLAKVNELEAAAVAAERLRAAYVFAKDEDRTAAMDKSLLANERLHQARAALLYPVTR